MCVVASPVFDLLQLPSLLAFSSVASFKVLTDVSMLVVVWQWPPVDCIYFVGAGRMLFFTQTEHIARALPPSV